MTANVDLRDRVLEALAPLPVTARSMFGGFGLYLEGRFCGLIAEGTLFFRTDQESRREFVARGMPAFQPAGRPRGPRTVDRNFRVPDEVLHDAATLQEWLVRAAAAQVVSPSR